MAERPYTRVYHSIVDDDRFATIYDDDRRLATWLRLLLVADQAYPSSANIPIGTNRAALAALVECGVVDLGTGNRYRIHGLATERERRSEAARASANARWQSGADAMRPHSERNAGASDLAMLAEPNRAKPNRAPRVRNTVDGDPHLRQYRDAIRKTYGTGMDTHD